MAAHSPVACEPDLAGRARVEGYAQNVCCRCMMLKRTVLWPDRRRVSRILAERLYSGSKLLSHFNGPVEITEANVVFGRQENVARTQIAVDEAQAPELCKDAC